MVVIVGKFQPIPDSSSYLLSNTVMTIYNVKYVKHVRVDSSIRAVSSGAQFIRVE